jgi:hypothetical protein
VHQNHSDGSWFGPQNLAGFDLLVASQNRRMEIDAGYGSRSSNLFRVEASLATVLQSGLKTDGDTMMGGARDIIMEVASSEN